MLEEDGHLDKLEEANAKNKKEKAGISLVDLAYRWTKAAKAVKKAVDAGKIVKKGKKKADRPPKKTPSRTEEMQELFQGDMNDKKPKRRGTGAVKKKSKNSFKSKSRYKRRSSPRLMIFGINMRVLHNNFYHFMPARLKSRQMLIPYKTLVFITDAYVVGCALLGMVTGNQKIWETAMVTIYGHCFLTICADSSLI